MGYRQHLMRSILAIPEQGGPALTDGTVVRPGVHVNGPSHVRMNMPSS
jgi:hypothetical protein